VDVEVRLGDGFVEGLLNFHFAFDELSIFRNELSAETSCSNLSAEILELVGSLDIQRVIKISSLTHDELIFVDVIDLKIVWVRLTQVQSSIFRLKTAELVRFEVLELLLILPGLKSVEVTINLALRIAVLWFSPVLLPLQLVLFKLCLSHFISDHGVSL
jgi:hypothetical protein